LSFKGEGGAGFMDNIRKQMKAANFQSLFDTPAGREEEEAGQELVENQRHSVKFRRREEEQFELELALAMSLSIAEGSVDDAGDAGAKGVEESEEEIYPKSHEAEPDQNVDIAGKEPKVDAGEEVNEAISAAKEPEVDDLNSNTSED
jgi:hypothetical protein